MAGVDCFSWSGHGDGKVGYRWSRDTAGLETMDYLEVIARVISHIPDKGQVMVHYYGLYANAHRGKVKKASLSPSALRLIGGGAEAPSFQGLGGDDPKSL